MELGEVRKKNIVDVIPKFLMGEKEHGVRVDRGENRVGRSKEICGEGRRKWQRRQVKEANWGECCK